MSAPRRLRNRILRLVSGLALGISLVFSLYTVVFLYAVEDAMLNGHLEEEARYQDAQWRVTGRWSVPRDPRITLHSAVGTLPAGIAELLRDEPDRIEFPGTGGSHYHLRALSKRNGEQAWLVYDAGRRLVVRPMLAGILWLFAGTTLMLLVIALVLGYIAARRTTSRLEQLASMVGGLDPARLPTSWPQAEGDDEVGVVARGLDALTTRLRAFVERERRFTRDASHELRTPLTVIRSAGDQLVAQPDLAEPSRRLADLVRESTVRLEQTVVTLLALAREDALDAETGCPALLPMIEQTVIEQAPRLEGKPVNVEVDVPGPASLPAPAAAVRILLANLVGNAFAHTKSGTVRIEAGEGILRITNPLADDAGGDADVPFASPGSPNDGFGFGLGIVRRLCERFGLDFELRVEGQAVVATLRSRPGEAGLSIG